MVQDSMSPGTLEAEEEIIRNLRQSWLHTGFGANLGYVNPHLKIKKDNNKSISFQDKCDSMHNVVL